MRAELKLSLGEGERFNCKKMVIFKASLVSQVRSSWIYIIDIVSLCSQLRLGQTERQGQSGQSTKLGRRW